MDIPLSWASTSGPTAYHPFAMSRALRNKLWRRLRRLNVEFQILDGLYDLPWDANLFRTDTGTNIAIGDELELRFPGIPLTHDLGVPAGPFLYPGVVNQVDFDEVGDTAELTIDVRLFANHVGGVQPHMMCSGPDVWYPSLVIWGTMGVSASSEYGFTFSSVPLPEIEVGPELATITALVLPDHGGGEMPLYIYGPEEFPVSGGTLVIEPNLWFSWDDLYDVDTGDPV